MQSATLLHKILQLVKDFNRFQKEKRISKKLKEIGYRRIPPPLFSWVKGVVRSIQRLVVVDRETRLLKQALEQLLEYDRFDYHGIRHCRVWQKDKYVLQPAEQPVYRQRPFLQDMMFQMHSKMPTRSMTDWVWGPGRYEKYKRSQALIDRLLREKVWDSEIDYIMEVMGVRHLRYRVLYNMKEYLQMRGYVPDLTREGVEPNPGPPKKRNPKVIVQPNIMRTDNPRRVRRNNGHDRQEQFLTHNCPCAMHAGVNCGIYMTMPFLKDQYGQMVITSEFCTQPGAYEGYSVYELLYMCIQAKYEMVQSRGTRRVYRRMKSAS